MLVTPVGQVEAQTAAAPFSKTFVTHHSGVFGGQTVNYTATVKSTILPDETASRG